MPFGEFAALIWRNPTALLLMAAFLCANFVAIVLLSWMPKFLYDKFHLSLAAAGLTATVFVQLASMVGSPLGGWLADRAAQAHAGGRMIVQAVGRAVRRALRGAVRPHAIRGCGWSSRSPPGDCSRASTTPTSSLRCSTSIRPEARGTAAGFMNMVGWLGGGAAPLVVGFIAAHTSLGAAIAMTAAMYLFAGSLLLAGIRAQRVTSP